MKAAKTIFYLIIAFTMMNCASGYEAINPKSINYVSAHESNNVNLEYKYSLLDKKYAKKEVKKGVQLVAVKITNNSDKDLTFGKDIKLAYDNGATANVLENDVVFNQLRQEPALYLLYLLLTPMNLTTTNGNQERTVTPIGVIVGPGLAGGNLIAASSANKKFKTEMSAYNINGAKIAKGETKHGLVGIESKSFNALTLKIE